MQHGMPTCADIYIHTHTTLNLHREHRLLALSCSANCLSEDLSHLSSLLAICHLTSTSKVLKWCVAEPPIQSEATPTVTAHRAPGDAGALTSKTAWTFLSITVDPERGMSSVLAVPVYGKSSGTKPRLAGTHRSGKAPPGQRTRLRQVARAVSPQKEQLRFHLGAIPGTSSLPHR